MMQNTFQWAPEVQKIRAPSEVNRDCKNDGIEKKTSKQYNLGYYRVNKYKFVIIEISGA